MSVIERRVQMLRLAVDRLRDLLADPMPGLLTWLDAVAARCHDINEIMDGKRDEDADHAGSV